MTDAERIAALEEALAEVFKRLDPQNLKQSLERAWDPRGGEPRIVDENGLTLDYVPAIQFLNATTTLDVPEQRVVVTPTAGVAELKGVFSPDATTGDTERLRFVDATDGVTRRYRVDTSTSVFGARTVKTVLSETGVDTGLRSEQTALVSSSSGLASQSLRANGSSANNATSLLLQADGNATAELTAVGFAGATGYASVQLSGNSTAGASSIVFYVGRTGGASGASRLEFDDDFLDLTLPGSSSRRILGLSQISHFMQTHPATNNETTAVKRAMRGPFTGAVAALAAGASTTFTLPDSRASGTSDYVVMGGPNGAAGSEDLAWSWVSAAGANDVDVTVLNRGAGALTATMRFYVVSTA